MDGGSRSQPLSRRRQHASFTHASNVQQATSRSRNLDLHDPSSSSARQLECSSLRASQFRQMAVEGWNPDTTGVSTSIRHPHALGTLRGRRKAGRRGVNSHKNHRGLQARLKRHPPLSGSRTATGTSLEPETVFRTDTNCMHSCKHVVRIN